MNSKINGRLVQIQNAYGNVNGKLVRIKTSLSRVNKVLVEDVIFSSNVVRDYEWKWSRKYFEVICGGDYGTRYTEAENERCLYSVNQADTWDSGSASGILYFRLLKTDLQTKFSKVKVKLRLACNSATRGNPDLIKFLQYNVRRNQSQITSPYFDWGGGYYRSWIISPQQGTEIIQHLQPAGQYISGQGFQPYDVIYDLEFSIQDVINGISIISEPGNLNAFTFIIGIQEMILSR